MNVQGQINNSEFWVLSFTFSQINDIVMNYATQYNYNTEDTKTTNG